MKIELYRNETFQVVFSKWCKINCICKNGFLLHFTNLFFTVFTASTENLLTLISFFYRLHPGAELQPKTICACGTVEYIKKNRILASVDRKLVCDSNAGLNIGLKRPPRLQVLAEQTMRILQSGFLTSLSLQFYWVTPTFWRQQAANIFWIQIELIE